MSIVFDRLVLGPPSKPEPQLTVVNISSLKVEWFTPYSWVNHSVIQYDMTLENSSASTNKVQTWTSNHTEFYITAPVTEGQRNSCDLLVINVTASSDIGQSQVGSVSGGFPIGRCSVAVVHIWATKYVVKSQYVGPT